MNASKNYRDEGGDVFVVGGEIRVVDEGKITFNGREVKPSENQESSKASTISVLKSDFNTLLSKLKASGLMTDDE